MGQRPQLSWHLCHWWSPTELSWARQPSPGCKCCWMQSWHSQAAVLRWGKASHRWVPLAGPEGSRQEMQASTGSARRGPGSKMPPGRWTGSGQWKEWQRKAEQQPLAPQRCSQPLREAEASQPMTPAPGRCGRGHQQAQQRRHAGAQQGRSHRRPRCHRGKPARPHCRRGAARQRGRGAGARAQHRSGRGGQRSSPSTSGSSLCPRPCVPSSSRTVR
mmetsp:Transcript_99860/g.265395  ORF Transcript_99860/g.265395 Transcript_99860/m.265395 type:complete len:217 (-) Transcript_99860:654-1304(-)